MYVKGTGDGGGLCNTLLICSLSFLTMPVFEPSIEPVVSGDSRTSVGHVGRNRHLCGIYTALRWFSFARRRNPCDPIQTDIEAVESCSLCHYANTNSFR